MNHDFAIEYPMGLAVINALVVFSAKTMGCQMIYPGVVVNQLLAIGKRQAKHVGFSTSTSQAEIQIVTYQLAVRADGMEGGSAISALLNDAVLCQAGTVSVMLKLHPMQD
jgi:hypothetical protein